MAFEYLERNVAQTRERIARAARESGRDEGEVLLLAAVKYAEPAEIDALCHRCGITDIGENRVQQLLEHREAVDLQDVNVHFIGTLQTNKVKYIIDKVCMIHSLDSLKLAAEIDRINAETTKNGGAKIDTLVAGMEQGKRSFKILRQKPDGKSYARDIANRYGLSYETITQNHKQN